MRRRLSNAAYELTYSLVIAASMVMAIVIGLSLRGMVEAAGLARRVRDAL